MSYCDCPCDNLDMGESSGIDGNGLIPEGYYVERAKKTRVKDDLDMGAV